MPDVANMRDSHALPTFDLAVTLLTVLLLAACSPTTEPRRPQSVDAHGSNSRAPIVGAIGRLPLAFEPNTGQAPAHVRYVGRGMRYRLWLTSTEAHFAAPSSRGDDLAIRLRLVGGAPAPRLTAEDELPGTVNYFVGGDAARWRRHMPTYQRVVYRGVYPDIDLVFHGDQRDAEFDFVLTPGADPRAIAIELDGGAVVSLADGDVVARTGDVELRLRRPVVYQQIDGGRRAVAGGFAVHGRRITFEVGDYDRGRPLVIDPVVSYSTYLGEAGTESGRGVGLDADGNVYAVVTGLGVVKLSADGSRLLYSTVLGDADMRHIAVDAAGHAYVAGSFAKPRSGSSGVYPVTANALQPTFGPPCNQGDTDGVMATLSPDGSQLLYSSFVGGRCTAMVSGIAIDAAGNVYIAGQASTATGYPATRPPFAPSGASGGFPGFIQVVAADASHYVYSALLLAGDGAPVRPTAIAVDAGGNAYVAGTAGPGLPTTPGVLQSTSTAGGAFLAKISADGSRLLYATYLGDASTIVSAVAVDSGARAYLAGHAGAGLPAVNAVQPTLAGGSDAFVARLNATGAALEFSTYLGGGADDAATGLGLDGAGNVYVAGPTNSADFPQRNALPPEFGTPGSSFVAALTPAGTALVYSTYFGDQQTFVEGLAVTSSGAAYLTGGTSSLALATVRPLQGTHGGGASDAFIARIDPGAAPGALRVFIMAPGDGTIVSGTVWPTVWIENAAAGARTYTLGESGTAVSTSTTTSNGPVSLPWATTDGPNGSRTITVTVRDAAGHTGSASRVLNVQNGGGGGDGTLRVVITQPGAGTTIHGTTWFTIWVEGAVTGTRTYTLSQGGVTVASTTSTGVGPVSLAWPTGPADNGSRTATVSVRDASGHTGAASVPLTVGN